MKTRNATRVASLAACALTLAACSDVDPTGPQDDLAAAVTAANGAIPTAITGTRPALPFHGTTVGMLVGMIPAPEGRCPETLPMMAIYQGAGNVTHMGKVQVSGTECLRMDPSDPSSGASGLGDFTLTAANGDHLFVAYESTVMSLEAPPSPWVLWSAEVHSTGGTGRFENAELVDATWNGGVSLVTYESWSQMDGHIRLR